MLPFVADGIVISPPKATQLLTPPPGPASPKVLLSPKLTLFSPCTEFKYPIAVSYTHLTLPTNREV